MTLPMKLVDHLSPKEKRSLLLQLLQQKLQRNSSKEDTLSGVELLGIFDGFAANVTQLSREVKLDSSIRFNGAPVVSNGQTEHIFLTGATGFLGAFLLHELLEQTTSQILCLVRAPDSVVGKQRILDNLRRYLLYDEAHQARIRAVPGDLAQYMLALSRYDFEALANQIDVIYHNGAMINWLYPYVRMKPANVLGTQEVIRLAAQGRVKPFHYVSSLSVFPLVHKTQGTTYYEDTSLDHSGFLHGGYTQSKWVAEKLVTVAQDRGLPATIYRPSLVIGHSQTGAWNGDDVVSRMLKSWVELGAAPDIDIALDMVPVDYVSRAIIYLSRRNGVANTVFHLAAPQPVTVQDLTIWLIGYGYPVQPAPYESWRDKMTRRANFTRQTAIYSLGPLLALELSEDTSWTENIPKFDVRRTEQWLDGAILSPSVNTATFLKYFHYFVKTGFLPKPDQMRQTA